MRGILFVESSPASPEQDAEYNEWYTGTHLPEVCAIPGIMGATRYRLRDDAGGAAKARYAAVYELDADDLSAPLAELGTRSADGRVSPPRALEMDPPPVIRIYELME